MEFDSRRRGRPASAVIRSTESTASTACFIWNILDGSPNSDFGFNVTRSKWKSVCLLCSLFLFQTKSACCVCAGSRGSIGFHNRAIGSVGVVPGWLSMSTKYHGAWSFRLFIFKWSEAKTTSFDKMISNMAQLCIDSNFRFFLQSLLDWERSPRSLNCLLEEETIYHLVSFSLMQQFGAMAW